MSLASDNPKVLAYDDAIRKHHLRCDLLVEWKVAIEVRRLRQHRPETLVVDRLGELLVQGLESKHDLGRRIEAEELVGVLQARQNVELVRSGVQRDGAFAGADRTGQDGFDVLARVELAQLAHHRRKQSAETVQKAGAFHKRLDVHRQHLVGISVGPEREKVLSRLLKEDALGAAGQGRGMLQHRMARQRHPLDDGAGKNFRIIAGQTHVSPLRPRACAWCFRIARVSARRATDRT